MENKELREENRELRKKGKAYKETLLKEREQILEEREHFKKLMKRVDPESKAEVNDYMDELTKQKQRINERIYLPLRELGKLVE